MAKKSDILSLYNEQFSQLDNSYKTRLRTLEREFLLAKNFDDESLRKDIEEYERIENVLRDEFIEIERKHHENNIIIENEYKSRFDFLGQETLSHTDDTNYLFEEENKKYQDILNQFEERKSEAFNTYLQLSKEANYAIERETRVHREFVASEKEKLDSIKENYQKLNSNLSNQLLWTMEKAKNALEKLKINLNDRSKNDIIFMNETIMDSLTRLRSAHDKLSELFYSTTHDLEHERDRIRNISKNKRKPHSDINQEMIQEFVKKIKEMNQKRISFEQMINQDLKNSLARLYPKLIQADADNDQKNLEKFILQKEIIEKKARYLLYRNKTISDSLISKYQNEIKKIKIDSFKRYEEIKLAYEMPASFFQNSVNLYSNFNFYINETFNDLDNILMDLIKYNQNYTEIKSNYIIGSAKVVEDYKINLMVRVNDLTTKLTNYISSIDDISNKIVTLESNNRLEIAEVKKKMENLEIQGDLQKYLALLEHDQYLAMFQHNKNIEKIQIEANYKTDLLNINTEVLMLNKNKKQLEEYKDYLIEVCKLEDEIQKKSYDKRLLEAKIYYKQQKALSDITMQLVKTKLSYQIKKENHQSAEKLFNLIDNNSDLEKTTSNQIVDFIHHMQNLIDLNQKQSENIEEYLTSASDESSYLNVLQENQDKLINEVTQQTEMKIKSCKQALELYSKEYQEVLQKNNHVIDKYLIMLKQLILLNESQNELDKEYLLKANGYLTEFVAVIKYTYDRINDYAYKYQVPSVIKKTIKDYEIFLFKLVTLNTKQLRKFKYTRKTKKQAYTLKTYYIKTLDILEKHQENSLFLLDEIKSSVMKNDNLFIEKAMKNDQFTKKIIVKQFAKLLKKAKSKKVLKAKQIEKIKAEATNLNRIFTDKVEKINNEFEKNKDTNTSLINSLKTDITKTIKKNNSELIKILKYIDRLYIKDSFAFDKQYQKYIKTFKHIQSMNKSSLDDELDYIKTLYNSRMTETQETIDILENRIKALPIEKEESYSLIAKEKSELVVNKRAELMKHYANIEKDKFISRPEYLKQIESISKRLPDDYIDLYKRIQSMEDQYIKQYSSINSDYNQNYKRFLEAQKSYQDTLGKHSLIYKPIEDIKKYNEKVLSTTEILYKDTISKSKESRESMQQAKLKSKEKQDRIINA